MDPNAPAVDYSQAFARARASRLGSMPPHEDSNEESFNRSTESSSSSDHVQNVDGLPVVRHSSRRTFFQFFFCGSRAQAVA
ncbi:hypothetical protein AXG93_1513s1000 [Marchantia polymorpha subsp. ruderalis]|uniref:Uncharacterized protein n=1 Tax=Marchantia polymorpha subsp. ruderalis TaxID=1480154 RepID=A0A176W9S0_MARPO|nr:hypothetical protein AXG93_1513s1000 [Marchantia polymorpha subsp. ruderalis]